MAGRFEYEHVILLYYDPLRREGAMRINEMLASRKGDEAKAMH
jgi:hypothetical protein